MARSNSLVRFSNADDKQRAFEQYKILVESINKANELRESSSNFWVVVNSLTISAVAYLRDNLRIDTNYKQFFLWTILILGIFICISWLSYLSTIKKSIEVRNKLLLELEAHFPVKMFTSALKKTSKEQEGGNLTFREMLVPSLFLLGYLFFAILLFVFPGEVASPQTENSGQG